MDPEKMAKIVAGGMSAMAGPVAGVAASVFGLFADTVVDKLTSENLPYKVETPNRKPPYGKKQPVSVFLKCRMELYHKQGETPPVGWGWMNTPQSATAFETREEAETEAFNFIALCPWFMGRLDIIKIKLER